MSTDLINLTCSACGSKEFEYPTEPKPEDQVVCSGCGAASTYGEIEAQMEKVADELADKVAADFASIFKK